MATVEISREVPSPPPIKTVALFLNEDEAMILLEIMGEATTGGSIYTALADALNEI